MRAELEAVVAADEEARSRVTSAEERARREAAAVREEVERQVAERRRTSEASLESELAAIRAEGAEAVAELCEREAAYRRTVAGGAAARLDIAAHLYARIVVEGPPEATR